MNEFAFSKYQGSGNDFVLIDHRALPFSVDSKTIFNLCHRRYGIGADGLILLCSSTKGDYAMRIFNSDGLEAEMCGNGLRCLVQFLIDLGEGKDSFLIETLKKIYLCTVKETSISVDMGIPQIIEEGPSEMRLDVGVPHLVIFSEDLSQFDREAKKRFSHIGINLNYAKVSPFSNTIHMRTFERGVEEETFACGTGATAVCMAAWKQFGLFGKIEVIFRSKETLHFEVIQENDCLKKIVMSGNAHHVFSGRVHA